MSNAYISIGSNVGDRKKNILYSLSLLDEYQNLEIQAVSSIYETIPFGVEEQDNFYNLAVEIKTEYSPYDLLMLLKGTEQKVGRKKRFNWGPREIDLDLALFDSEIIDEPKLKIPHPGVYERDFFLVPLLELKSDLTDPVSGKKLKEYLNLITTNHIINKFEFNLNEINGS